MKPHDKKTFIKLMKRKFSQSSHVNCSICKKCGGECCKRGGCGLMTCDVPELTVDGIRKMLDTNRYSITLFSVELISGVITPIPIMNAREVDSERVNNSIIRKPCALQGENGCIFSDDERPTLGLLYIPDSKGKCRLLVNGMELLEDWAPHRQMMEQVILEETGQSSQELFYSGCVQAAREIKQKMDMRKKLNDAEMHALQILDTTGLIVLLDE